MNWSVFLVLPPEIPRDERRGGEWLPAGKPVQLEKEERKGKGCHPKKLRSKRGREKSYHPKKTEKQREKGNRSLLLRQKQLLSNSARIANR